MEPRFRAWFGGCTGPEQNAKNTSRFDLTGRRRGPTLLVTGSGATPDRHRSRREVATGGLSETGPSGPGVRGIGRPREGRCLHRLSRGLSLWSGDFEAGFASRLCPSRVSVPVRGRAPNRRRPPDCYRTRRASVARLPSAAPRRRPVDFARPARTCGSGVSVAVGVPRTDAGRPTTTASVAVTRSGFRLPAPARPATYHLPPTTYHLPHLTSPRPSGPPQPRNHKLVIHIR
jgi:hypothetical protein